MPRYIQSTTYTRKKASTRRRVAIFCVVAVLVAASLLASNSRGWFADIWVQTTRPVRFAVGAALRGGVGVSEFFSSRKNMSGQLEKLRADARASEEVFGELSALRAENALLRQQAEDPFSVTSYSRINAHVVGKGSAVFGQELVIDRGSESGVAENDIVVAGSRRLVGKVRIVSARFARVTLVGDRSFRASAKITDTSGAAVLEAALYEGLLQGKGLGCASIDMVPAKALLKEGDEVLTSGFDGVFPPDLVVGRIGKVLSGPSDFFQRASLDLSVDMGELDVVSIILGIR